MSKYKCSILLIKNNTLLTKWYVKTVWISNRTEHEKKHNNKKFIGNTVP